MLASYFLPRHRRAALLSCAAGLESVIRLFFTAPRRSCVLVAVCLSMSRITDERIYGRRPNVGGMGTG